MITKTKLKS